MKAHALHRSGAVGLILDCLSQDAQMCLVNFKSSAIRKIESALLYIVLSLLVHLIH
jgi:hypothetical protein